MSVLLTLFLPLAGEVGAAPDVSLLGPFGGDVRSLAVHPARPLRYYLGTSDGQIYVSLDAGSGWRQLVPGIERREVVVDNLVFHPEDPDILYAACWALQSNQGFLFRTRDGGENWKRIPTGPFNSPIRAIALAPSDPEVIALGISEGVLLSLDGGRSWDRISRGYRSLYNVHSLAFDVQDSSTLYVGTWHLGWKTRNRGRKWQAIRKGMIFDSDIFSLIVHPRDPTTIYASACTGIYRSADGGLNWTKLRRGLPKAAKRTRTLQLDPSNPSVIYAGTTLGLFASRDAGTSWRQLIPDVVVNAVAIGGSGTLLVGTDDRGVLRSRDGGASFEEANRGFIHRQIGALTPHPSQTGVLYASVTLDGDQGGFFISRNGGGGWIAFNPGLGKGASFIRAILPAGGSTRVFVGTSTGIFVGVPLQEPWRRIESTRSLDILSLTFSDSRETVLLAATSSGLYQLESGGGELRKLMIPDYDGRVNHVLSSRKRDTLFASTQRGVFRSDDAGQTWTVQVKGLPSLPVNVTVESDRHLLLGTPEGLFLSADRAESWSRARGVFPLDIVAVTVNPLNPAQVLAAESSGAYVFLSLDHGRSWRAVALSGMSRVSQVAFAPSGNLFAGTLSEGVYLLSSPESWTFAE
ncbi:MAG: WD40/YVTN/BNR-like repeat-containing protein [Acidobacteriota bacterium]